jgi:glutamyl-tRNA synthetase
MHMGNVRTAIYNWLFARHQKGKFILRIEDTDRTRSTPEATQAILDGLSWLGLKWDEGPFFQSQRLDLYNEAAQKLLNKGLAYYQEDAQKGEAIYLKMPQKEKIIISDLIHEKIAFEGRLFEDFVIVKSDGFPTYNFACVVDDIDLKITDVIRGDEHISNTPRQLAVYEALQESPPRFAHLPMILGSDGSKLSKRHGATSLAEYKARGFPPRALVNFLALLGWSPGDNREFLNLDELISEFSSERIRKTSSQFDENKLLWLSAEHIKNATLDEFIQWAGEFLQEEAPQFESKDEAWWDRFFALYKERLKTLGDLITQAGFFFGEDFPLDEEAVDKILRQEGAPELLGEACEALKTLDDFSAPEIERALRDLAGKREIGFGKLAQPVRVATTGTRVSASLFETLTLLGKERVLKRLSGAINMLSG